MSRAFVKDDGDDGPEVRYDLPEPEPPHFDESGAWARQRSRVIAAGGS